LTDRIDLEICTSIPFFSVVAVSIAQPSVLFSSNLANGVTLILERSNVFWLIFGSLPYLLLSQEITRDLHRQMTCLLPEPATFEDVVNENLPPYENNGQPVRGEVNYQLVRRKSEALSTEGMKR
jgi:hypothetical protein